MDASLNSFPSGCTNSFSVFGSQIPVLSSIFHHKQLWRYHCGGYCFGINFVVNTCHISSAWRETFSRQPLLLVASTSGDYMPFQTNNVQSLIDSFRICWVAPIKKTTKGYYYLLFWRRSLCHLLFWLRFCLNVLASMLNRVFRCDNWTPVMHKVTIARRLHEIRSNPVFSDRGG